MRLGLYFFQGDVFGHCAEQAIIDRSSFTHINPILFLILTFSLFYCLVCPCP